MSRVIGIDLGTTNSCVACLEGTRPVVIPNFDGLPTTPSVVSFTTSGERLIGTPALRQGITNPRNTIYAVKRLIGRKFHSPQVAEAQRRLPYALVEAPNGDCLVSLVDRTLTPQEISAVILGYLKGCAEAYMGEEVAEAVVTVPAHFDDHQRQATKDAAQICGLNVLRVINEPTAAGLVYGLGSGNASRAAVFDLGGGTFDVTILEIGGDVFQVLATAGDTYLGGEDFDQRILEWLLEDFRRETAIDLQDDKLALQRIKEAVEKAKKELSFTRETEIHLPFICSGDASSSRHIRKLLTRSLLEDLTRDLVARTLPLIEQALADARLAPADIQEVILVGGQTRMPLVKRQVEAFFGRPPAERVNPDEIVAMGAAVQAGIVKGEVRDMVLLLDVCPLSLGIEIEGDVFQVLIERNSTIPVLKTMAFTTVEHNQRRVRIHVLQGEEPRASLNTSLATFELVGIEPAPAGVPQIDVTFAIDADGLVSVSARDKATGREQFVEVRPHAGLLPAELQALIRREQRALSTA